MAWCAAAALANVAYGANPPSTVRTTLTSDAAPARSPVSASACARARKNAALRTIGISLVRLLRICVSVIGSRYVNVSPFTVDDGFADLTIFDDRKSPASIDCTKLSVRKMCVSTIGLANDSGAFGLNW